MFSKEGSTARVVQFTLFVVVVTVFVIYEVLQFELWLDHGAAVSGGSSGPGDEDAAAAVVSAATGMGRRDAGAKRAALVIIVQPNNGIEDVLATISSYEQRFNAKYGYEWVVVDAGSIDRRLYVEAAALASGGVRGFEFRSHTEVMDFPHGLDMHRARVARTSLELPKQWRYMASQRGRHLSRFAMSYVYDLDSVWSDFDYYWKVPAGSTLKCDVNYDVFEYMQQNGIRYGWSLMMKDFDGMAPTLMQKVGEYMRKKKHISGDELRKVASFLFDESSTGPAYRGCSFNSDFELADVSFFRSKAYRDFFKYLDSQNGIYYETWRDPAVKTIAATLLLPASQVKYFDDLAVDYPLFGLSNCPVNEQVYLSGKCSCNPAAQLDSAVASDGVNMHQSHCVASWLKFRGQNTPGALQETPKFIEAFGASI